MTAVRKRAPRPTGSTGNTAVLAQLRVLSTTFNKRLDTVDKRHDEMHQTLVLIENHQKELRGVAEGLSTFWKATDRKFDELRQELLARIDLVARSVAGHSTRFDEVDASFKGMGMRLDKIEAELRNLREEITRKADGADLKALEQRVTALERVLNT